MTGILPTKCRIAWSRLRGPEIRQQRRSRGPHGRQDREKYVEFGDAIAVREENVERMEFQSQSGVTSTTPRASRD